MERLVQIILLGDTEDRRLGRAMRRCLLPGWKQTYRERQLEVYRRGGTALLLRETSCIQRLQDVRAVIAVKQGAGKLLPTDMRACCTILPHAEPLPPGRRHTQLLTCGMSLRDSLTISAQNSEQATVSLLRPVTGVFGHLIEPQDILLPTAAVLDSYSLLTAGAVRLLLGLT